MMKKTLFLLLLPVLAALAFGSGTSSAQADPVYASPQGTAINGYDPVAYFRDGKPQQGSPDFHLTWQGATWHFKNAENRAAFEKSPETYAPQYGGYCAWAVSRGYTAPTAPEAWDILDGKLYLNYSLGVQSTWRQDRAGNIAKADGRWPKLRDQ